MMQRLGISLGAGLRGQDCRDPGWSALPHNFKVVSTPAWTASIEGAYFTDRDQRYNLGGELWLKNIVALRAGYKFDYDAESWTIGAGLKGTFSGRNIRLDIAYSDFGKYFDAPIRLSFSGSL